MKLIDFLVNGNGIQRGNPRFIDDSSKLLKRTNKVVVARKGGAASSMKLMS